MYLLRISLICLFVIGLMVGCASQKTEVAEESAVPITKESAAPTAPAATEVSLAVTGMTCGACVAKVQGALANIDGVINAAVSMPGSAVVKVNEKVTVAQLTEAVTGAGFSAKVSE
ncbi:TPA: hypothetical protein EYN65_22435 [Candidatus Poribacteria bacterium]|nr:hypothetical protein [Candidatus Poribacteria bacterium]HIN30285.1 hypothetical protein [Candidatus Poribacteria bacterium]HIO80204.1 hypothetical protein [Candidatus Poribacteria bacterium]